MRIPLAAALLAAAAGAALAAPPQRICSLSLASDEMLALLAPPGKIVCVSNLADDPELSNVARRFAPSIPRLASRIEPVLAARPDLVVLTPWNDPAVVDLLHRTGVATTTVPDAWNFETIRAATLDLGKRVGAERRAAEIVADMDKRLGDLDRRLAGAKERPRVLSFSHLIVAGTGTTVDTLIRRAGARNAAAEIGLKGHKQAPLERIIALDPDWLLLGFDPGDDAAKILEAYPLLKKTRAAREGRVIVMRPRLMTTVSPFLVDGAFELARALHPAAFPREAGR
ncbi:MAG: ABC transporter substrate-binding protein [Candidatus Polarisedimenticolia bacterium]|nr:ABC transporter substrate-binding protein [bacterium]